MPPRDSRSRRWFRIVWGKVVVVSVKTAYASPFSDGDFQKLPTHPALFLKKPAEHLLAVTEFTCSNILLIFFSSFQIYISIFKKIPFPPIFLSFGTFHLDGALNYKHHLNLVFTTTRIHCLCLPSAYTASFPHSFFHLKYFKVYL